MSSLRLSAIAKLRTHTRRRRMQLSTSTLRQSEMKILTQIGKVAAIQQARHIGIYLDAFGEIPTRKLIIRLIKHHKYVYLPVICPMNRQLRWHKISLHHLRAQRFALHQLQMQQPMPNRAVAVSKLDIVLMPLVIFDAWGQRVGMGGGFYDRTLQQHPYRPLRIGLAHDFQYTADQLACQPWDQGLDQVLTPSRIYNFKTNWRI